MAAVSAAQTTTTSSATTLTPPSSSHGNGHAWDSPPHRLEDSAYAQRSYSKSQPLQNKIALSYGSPNPFTDQSILETTDGVAAHNQDNLRQGRPRDASIGLTERTADVHERGRNDPVSNSNKRPAAKEAYGTELDDSSKWIHRDKLARIESEELQAAGIVFPKSRARSKPRRDVSVEKAAGYQRSGPETDSHQTEPRSRKNSTVADRKAINFPSSPSWDLRMPDEIAEESYFASPYTGRGSSRIPVAKISPVPIPLEQMERDILMARRRDDSPGTEDSIAYPKSRSRSASMRPGDGSNDGPVLHSSPRASRSVSDMSPRKISGVNSSATGSRKALTTTKSMPTAARPKTRNGTSKDSNSSGTGATRPSTRSGELSREMSVGAASKQPEGEPPWMISAYRPDPRLPPEQQLLPTVARRLQQEKWEREGKFGNVYDREFRPLNDEGFLSPPEASEKPIPIVSLPPNNTEKQTEWPLKPEMKSPTAHQGRAGSYSTIPRIQDKPNMSPLPSPRRPLSHAPDASMSHMSHPAPPPRDEDESAKQGCGCCIVM